MMTTDDTQSIFLCAWHDDLSSPVLHSQRRMEGAWGSHPLPGLNFLNYFEAAVLGLESRFFSRYCWEDLGSCKQANTKHGRRWEDHRKWFRMVFVTSTLGFSEGLAGRFLCPWPSLSQILVGEYLPCLQLRSPSHLNSSNFLVGRLELPISVPSTSDWCGWKMSNSPGVLFGMSMNHHVRGSTMIFLRYGIDSIDGIEAWCFALLRYQTFAIPRCKRVLLDPLQMSACSMPLSFSKYSCDPESQFNIDSSLCDQRPWPLSTNSTEVRFLIGEFPTLFGTDLGERLQLWARCAGFRNPQIWITAWI